MTRRAAAVLALAALAACASPPQGIVGSDTARSPGLPEAAFAPRPGTGPLEATASGPELAFVTRILGDIQIRSFAENREFCGYIGRTPTGDWISTPIMGGTEASCPLPSIPPEMRLVASFHTHSTYSPAYASEWPTTQDMLTDAETGIDGYIATPGGRLWHVDTDTMTVRQICGRGCLPQDPNYVAEDDGPLTEVMTFHRLQAWERSGGPY